MSGELKIASPSTGLTVYGHIYSPAGLVWNGTTFETYAAANYANYDISLTEQGSSGVYIGDFPTGVTTSAVYDVFYYDQAGASPAQGDAIIGAGTVSWGATTASTTSTSPGTGITFLEMQQELSDRLGAYDNAVSGDLTKLKRWLNMANRDITSRMNWPFMLGHETIKTVADITDGTVSVSSGSTTLTFSSAPSVSVEDWFIKFSSGDSWYKISSHTAASVSASISVSYGESSNLSAGTYTLRKLFYATATPMDSILDIKKTVSGIPLESINAREADVFMPLYWDSGTVYKYISSVPDSTGGVRFSLLYSPSSVEVLQVRGIKQIPVLSSDTDSSIIPGRWHSAIIDLASFYGFSSLDDTRADTFYNRAEAMIASMAQIYSPDLGRHRVMRGQAVSSSQNPAYSLPPQYGVIG